MLVDVLCLSWILIALVSTLGVVYAARCLGPPAALPYMPRVAIIVPIKGAGPSLPEHLRRLRAQDYEHARIIVVVESVDDPAYAVAAASEKQSGLDLSILVAGRCDAVTGQKVWNLLAALATLRPDDEFVAFIDADTLPAASWLRRLVGPLVLGKAAVVTGYRWLIPADESLAATMVAGVDHAIASCPRLRHWNIAWGGTTAMSRHNLERFGLAGWWKGAMSDDMQATRALWAAGVKLVCPDGMLVVSPVAHRFKSAFEFTRRQHVIARAHLPRYYMMPFAIIVLPFALACCAVVAASRGNAVAIVTIVVAIALGILRRMLRRRMECWILKEADLPVRRLSPASLIGFVGPLFHVMCLLIALPSRKVRWAGIGYTIVAPQTIVVTREEP